MNKSRALLQLDTNDDEDATEPVAASSSTSNPGKVKVYDVCFRSDTDYEKTDLGRVVSMPTNPSSEGKELSENTSILLLSFDKKTIFKASNFTFALDQKCYNADVEILLELTTGQPLCIYQDPQSLLVSLHNYGIKRIRWQNGALLMSSVLKKNPSSILRIGRTEEKLVFSDCQDHTVNFFVEEESRITYSMGTVQGFQDGYTVAFNSPSSLVAFGDTVFVCDTSNRAVRIITSLTTYRLLGEKMDSFIDLFQLRENSGKDYVNHHTSLNDGLKILKGTADLMKEIEVQARARTGRRCSQGPDLGFTKPTRDSFQMLPSSFAKIKSILDDKGLLHIAEEIDFSSFTTLQVDHFFSGMGTPSRPTPDMHDYASRRPNCITESLQKTYQSAFVVYSGPQSHYIEKKVHEKEPEWLYERCKSRTVHTLEERDETREEAKELTLFAKEFGQGVRQQRVRGKTQERAGTLPLAISMMKRIIAPETRNLNMLEELQSLEEESGDHLDAGTSVEKNRVVFSKGEVVALKHNYRTYLEPFFSGNPL